MLSNRSKCMALAAASVLLTSCLHTQRVRHQHALAVKAEAEADLAHAQADAVRARASGPEFFEGDEPPATPAGLVEERPSAPSVAHVWVAGAHERRNGQWVWVKGHYAVPPTSELVWVPGHWVAHQHGYVWIAGAWR